MKTIFHAAGSRGYAKHGWLTTHHSFSFASYYDPARMGFGVLRVLNDDVIAPGTGFGEHPHDNMEIITIVLSGALRHEDSMGNSSVIESGEVQVMSAGSGVVHAEYNASSTDPLSLLQIWILTRKKNVAPRYDQKRFDVAKEKNVFHRVVGAMSEIEVLTIHQDAQIFLGRFEAGAEFNYRPINPKRGTYFFMIEGAATIASVRLSVRDGLGVSEAEEVVLRAENDAFILALDVPMMP